MKTREPDAGFRVFSFPGGGALLIPILIVRDMQEAIAFYTGVLDLELRFAWPEEAPFYAVLGRGSDELHLNLNPGNGRHGHSSAIVVCGEVDALFAAFVARGLAVPSRPDSPVHAGPLEQSWGTREFYVDDPSGNTLVFQQRR
jgi:catechol 2,3-dioxygenase-like lactoylglutathione lyase family enzyme